MTTYDDVYKLFLNISKSVNGTLPQTMEQIYDFINTGVIYYNNRMRETISCDNTTETISNDLTQDRLLVLANFMKLVYLENEVNLYTSIWQPFAKDIGLNNYQSTLKGKQYAVQTQEEKIDILIQNFQEDYL